MLSKAFRAAFAARRRLDSLEGQTSCSQGLNCKLSSSSVQKQRFAQVLPRCATLGIDTSRGDNLELPMNISTDREERQTERGS